MFSRVAVVLDIGRLQETQGDPPASGSLGTVLSVPQWRQALITASMTKAQGLDLQGRSTMWIIR